MPNGGASIDRKTPPQVPSTRMPYGRKDGSSESPVRNTSTARAQRLPSLIARTTSDWPLRVSPQAKTPGTEVAKGASEPSTPAFALPRASVSTPKDLSVAAAGCMKPMASSTR